MHKIETKIEAARTLPGSFYGAESSFEAVKEKVLARSWQFVNDEDAVRNTSYAWPFRFIDGLVEEPLILVRDQQDDLRCMSNVCTHRGNLLIDHPCAIKGGITCGYHGRRFGMDGCFKHMPETDGMQNFPSRTDDLPNVPLKQWGKFLFTAIDPAFDFDALMKPMMDRLSWLPLHEFKYDPNRSREYLVQANWALYCDNYLEGFHIPFIHRELAQSLDYNQYASEIYPYSNLQLGIASDGELCFDLPKESPDYGQNIAAYYYWLYPNMMFNFYPWGLSINIVRPMRANLTKVIFKSYVWDESKIEQGAGAMLDRVEREDEAVVEKVHAGVTSRLYQYGRFSPKMEKGVHHFHLLLSEALDNAD